MTNNPISWIQNLNTFSADKIDKTKYTYRVDRNIMRLRVEVLHPISLCAIQALSFDENGYIERNDLYRSAQENYIISGKLNDGKLMLEWRDEIDLFYIIRASYIKEQVPREPSMKEEVTNMKTKVKKWLDDININNSKEKALCLWELGLALEKAFYHL